MRKPPKKIVVEGVDDQAVVIHLLKHHFRWPEGIENAPVHVEVGKGVNGILDTDFLKVKLKESDLQTLGIVVDADSDSGTRWSSIKTVLEGLYPSLPTSLPQKGLIVTAEGQPRLGVWIMPDCWSSGMMETFLRACVPNTPTARELWSHAESSLALAIKKNASVRSAHLDKAKIHTWLAWQDPPGERLGLAIAKKILDPFAVSVTPFVDWCRSLFDL